MFVISTELCEETGVFIGDGSLTERKRGYLIKYSGNSIEDNDYFTVFLPKLIKSVYSINPKIFIEKEKHVCRTYFYSKEIAMFKHNILEFPIGKKTDFVKIPKIILDSGRENIISLLRGYFDTDGCVYFSKKNDTINYYPKISFKTKSNELMKQLENILSDLGFNFYVSYNMPNGLNNNFKINRLDISGKNNLEKWFREIGSNNERNITKYKTWKKYGYCPSNLNIFKRKMMLDKTAGVA